MDTAKQSQDCVRCHTEHAGRNLEIIRWTKSRGEFDHREAGYPLEGKHSGLACEKCHKPAFESKDELRTLKVDNPDRTYLGLSPACTTCHEDEHRGQLATECLRCHSFDGWQPALGFDHSKSHYPLTGLHEKVKCQNCHPTIETPKPHTQYTGLAFQACSNCHKDPHRGAFAGTCQSCHTTDGWKRVEKSLPGFDHSRTKFPLLGKHQDASCAKCHKTADFKQTVAHALCFDCHKSDDPHNGQFRARPDKGECGPCHDEKGFKPSTFTVALHQKIDYKLVGKHESVSCEKCHTVSQKVTLYRLPHGQCKDCHADAHKKQFSGAPNFDRCENCHAEHGFQPSTFKFSQHQKSRFPLVGSHGAFICSDCHKPLVASEPKISVQYHWDNLDCTGCHEDPHRDQLATGSPARAGRPGWNCADCHIDSTWKVETRMGMRFDHSTTDFKLVAGHVRVTCGECHRPQYPEERMKSVIFHDAPKACRGCHEDVHGGQFDSPGKVAGCEDCHTVERWKPSRFDHFSSTTFSLAGAHEAVYCKKCHSEERQIGGRLVVIYKGTPSKCSACHSQ